MTISMFDIFPRELFEEMLTEKYIRIKEHPSLPLRIIEYTEKAVYDNTWNIVTRNCRGLIVDENDLVVARPFAKFMNYNPESDSSYLDREAVVLDKLDGSLGILYTYNGVTEIATKGSFTSDQAIHATELFNSRYQYFEFDKSETFLFEIVYPDNRIVCDYGDMDDLVLLGARDIDSGQESLPNEIIGWFGLRATTFPYKSLREAVESLPRPNAEGFVVFFPETGERLKVKYEDYLAIHRIISDLTPRRIWEAMKLGNSLGTILAPIPNEWHEWTRKIYDELTTSFSDTMSEVYKEYRTILFSLTYTKWTRKDFAEEAKKSTFPGLMFSLLDGRDISGKIWDMVRP